MYEIADRQPFLNYRKQFHLVQTFQIALFLVMKSWAYNILKLVVVSVIIGKKKLEMKINESRKSDTFYSVILGNKSFLGIKYWENCHLPCYLCTCGICGPYYMSKNLLAFSDFYILNLSWPNSPTYQMLCCCPELKIMGERAVFNDTTIQPTCSWSHRFTSHVPPANFSFTSDHSCQHFYLVTGILLWCEPSDKYRFIW